MRTRTQALFDRYYFSKPAFVTGTAIFHQLCQSHFGNGRCILELGAGAKNSTTAFLAGLGSVTGLDVSGEVQTNPDLEGARIYNGITMPFADRSFRMCVSNYVLEHVGDPAVHFSEIFRVLEPGGSYCFRTPNRWHYITIASHALPHAVHLHVANRLRGLDASAHDPWPTVYRANTRRRLRALAEGAGFEIDELRVIEAEPSYGAAHPLLFYPMMAYERMVNSSNFFSSFRVNILGTFRKPL